MATPPGPLGAAPPVVGGRDVVLPGDGIRLAATRWSGTGTPVVLLHGLASQRRFWNLVVPHLLGLPVVALDQRGHGDSEQPDTGYDDATLVRDVATALDAMGISRAVVVGHSWGANVAVTLAATRPERVLAVVAVDGGLTTPRERHPLDETRRRLAPPRIEVPPDELGPMLREGHRAMAWSPEVEAALLPIFEVGPDGLARARFRADNHLRVVDALWAYDPEALLPDVRVSCWAAVATPIGEPDDPAERDRAERQRRALERAARLLPRPRLLTLAGALHDVPLQWPALVAGIVRAAVDEAARPAPDGGAA